MEGDEEGEDEPMGWVIMGNWCAMPGRDLMGRLKGRGRRGMGFGPWWKFGIVAGVWVGVGAGETAAAGEGAAAEGLGVRV